MWGFHHLSLKRNVIQVNRFVADVFDNNIIFFFLGGTFLGCWTVIGACWFVRTGGRCSTTTRTTQEGNVLGGHFDFVALLAILFPAAALQSAANKCRSAFS